MFAADAEVLVDRMLADMRRTLQTDCVPFEVNSAGSGGRWRTNHRSSRCTAALATSSTAGIHL